MRKTYAIMQYMADGPNYYCGLSAINLPGGQRIIGNEWSTDRKQSQKYLTEDVARNDLAKLLPDNPFAIVTVLFLDSDGNIT